MGETKRQHYVPKFYLDYFADDTKQKTKCIWQFEKNHNSISRKAVRRTSNNICVQGYFYSIKADAQHEGDMIEKYLSGLETDAAEILRSIVENKFDSNNEEKRYNLTKFVAFMYLRTKQAREWLRIIFQNFLNENFNEKINREGGIKEFLKRNNGDNIDPDKFIDIFNKIKVIPPNEAFVQFMLKVGTEIVMPGIFIRRWGFLVPESENRFYVTSDNPVVMYNAKFRDQDFIPGLGLIETDTIFPITPRICFIASLSNIRVPTEGGTKKISDNEVSEINLRVANLCYKNLFANTYNYDMLFSI